LPGAFERAFHREPLRLRRPSPADRPLGTLLAFSDELSVLAADPSTPRVANCGKCDACHDASSRPFWSKRTRRMGYPKGAGLSPLPHLRRRADPPLLACLLTRLAMRDRNRDARPALRQQAVGGGGGRLCGRPPPRCLKLATVEDLRPGSGRALPGRKASASLRVRRTPLPRRTALAASY